MGVDVVKYAKGKLLPKDFEDVAAIPNNKSIEILENGEYTFIVYDKVGNSYLIQEMINNIDLRYINFSITKGNITYNNSLNEMPNALDDGIVVYNGKVDNEKNITIRLWVSKEYEGDIDNNSFSIKINPGQEN